MFFRISLACVLLAVPGLLAAQKSEPSSPVEFSEQQTLDIANGCVRPEDRMRPMAEMSAEQRRTMIACVMRASSAALNRQLPVNVDDSTIMESTTVDGATLTYNARINLARSELQSNAAQLLDQAARRFVCSTPDMTQTIAMGGSYRYVWIDRDGALVHRMLIDRC